MRYEVVSAGSLHELVQIVSDMISEGWEPQGGVSASSIESQGVVMQAMIKEA